ncbi:MAG TPA: peptide-methionine (S)-S-oxide reductase MsrA [Candidatus Omnitrophota bacterium]|nr:peptide-methionine (S)-S-oxide reductase MsrA [Candidatus Omnitrophota bacterium]
MNRSIRIAVIAVAMAAASLATASNGGAAPVAGRAGRIPPPNAKPAVHAPALATFAGGCFWCMETAFEGMPGVLSVTSGFSGGPEKNPTYKDVSAGKTHHMESVQVEYDPQRTSYARLLTIYWHNIDPTQGDGQFCDRGAQYRSAIFYRSPEEHRLAQISERAAAAEIRVKKPFVTQIVPFTAFWAAEEYHQDYYRKNPADYHAYRTGCGRDRRLKEIWGVVPHTAG